MNLEDRYRALAELYEHQKYAIVGMLSKPTVSPNKKAKLLISISKICETSADIVAQINQSSASDTEKQKAHRTHGAWQDLLVFAWEATMEGGDTSSRQTAGSGR